MLRYADEGFLYQYMTSYHWAIAHLLGSEIDVFAGNSLERIFSTLCFLIGLLLMSSLVALCSATLVQLQTRKYDQMMEQLQLRRFLRQYSISARVAAKVQEMIKERMSKPEKLVMKDVAALELLSDNVRMELEYEIYMQLSIKHGFFHLLNLYDNGKTLALLCHKCMDMLMVKGSDRLFSPTELALGMYMIRSGTHNYSQRIPVPVLRRARIASLNRSGSAGSAEEPSARGQADHGMVEVPPGSQLAEASLWAEWSHVGICSAVTDSVVILVKAEATAQTLCTQEFVDVVYRNYASIFYTQLITSKPPRCSFPDDLGAPFTSLPEIMVKMDTGVQSFLAHVQLQTGYPASLQQELAAEVASGQVSVAPDETGLPTRFVAQVGLELINPQGLTFIVLGRVQGDDSVVPVMRFPHIRPGSEETLDEAVQRLISTRLPQLSAGVVLTGVEGVSTLVANASDEDLESSCRSLGLRTASLAVPSARNLLHQGRWIEVPSSVADIRTRILMLSKQGSMEGEAWARIEPHLQRMSARLIRNASSRMQNVATLSPFTKSHSLHHNPNIVNLLMNIHNIYMIDDLVCTWLTKDEVSELQTPQAQVVLKEWLEGLVIDADYGTSMDSRMSRDSPECPEVKIVKVDLTVDSASPADTGGLGDVEADPLPRAETPEEDWQRGTSSWDDRRSTPGEKARMRL